MYRVIDCIDAGSDYCPCQLAEKKECILCPMLNGNAFCDCVNWKGTCIYQEFIWNKQKSRDLRQYECCRIVSRKKIREDIFVLEIKVGRTMARDLNNIGAFVFLKKCGDEDVFSTPISIMCVDILKNTITAAIRISGVKTKALSECSERIMLKGPYWNGIQGQRYIKNLKNENILIAAKGLEAAPCVLAAKKLLKNSNQIMVLLDVGTGTENFTKKYFINLGCEVTDTSLCSKEGHINDDFKALAMGYIRKFNIKAVLIGGTDLFYSQAISYILDNQEGISFATVNNSTMCCGEGICGSCHIKTGAGRLKSCKQQYDPAQVYRTAASNIDGGML